MIASIIGASLYMMIGVGFSFGAQADRRSTLTALCFVWCWPGYLGFYAGVKYLLMKDNAFYLVSKYWEN